MAKRPKPRLTTSAGEIGQLQYNEQAFAQRGVDAGGVYDIIGPAATAVRVGEFASLRIVNTAATWAYVAIGGAAVAAPTGLADGYGIPPNSECFLSTGDKGAFVRASAATVGVYKLIDSIVITDRANDMPKV